jgi:cytochrome P450
MTGFLRELIAARRREPRDDLISVFLGGLGSGLIYDEEEIVANLMMIIAVGFKTTSNLIATGTFLLLEHDRQQALLRADPTLCAGAVEEIARFDGPVFFTTRVAREDMRLHGERVSSGDLVLLCVAAANRDPAVFSEPDEFLVSRAKNPHLAFGAGAYSCLGARLARAQCRIAFERMLRWMPAFELAGQPDWYEFPPLARWLARLPIGCSRHGGGGP